MSALADFAHKFGLESRELKIGQSFFKETNTVLHTIRYDFLPASIDHNKTSAVDFGENGQVTITMPNVEGSGTTESVYQGQRKPHQKECVLIIDHETGEMILERLNQSMIVKKARLRQEDLTGKSLALNKVHVSSASSPLNASNLLSNGGGSSSMTSSQTKTDKKTVPSSYKSVSNSSKSTKQSPPLSTAVRANGFAAKNTTPSPPSMPIFSANKGSLLHSTNGTIVANSNSNVSDSTMDWSSKVKSNSGDTGKSNRNTTASAVASTLSSNRLSEDSSSDSSDGDNSDDESSSSPSSDSSSDDDDLGRLSGSAKSNSAQQTAAVRSSAPSMPSMLSMPTSLGALSVASSNNSNSLMNHSSPNVPTSILSSNDLKTSTQLGLSEDSDSSEDDDDRVGTRKPTKNGTGGSYLKFPSAASTTATTTITTNGTSSNVNNHSTNKMEPVLKSSSTFTAADNKPFPDSMPKFNSDTLPVPAPQPPPTVTATTNFSMPKYSQLSQDLQLSESGSDSDD